MQPVQRNIHDGFVPERAPHITLQAIVSTPEIDILWGEWQMKFEPLREKLAAEVVVVLSELGLHSDRRLADVVERARARLPLHEGHELDEQVARFGAP